MHPHVHLPAIIDVHDIGPLTGPAHPVITSPGDGRRAQDTSPPVSLASPGSDFMPLDSDFRDSKATQAQKKRIKERTLDPNNPEFYLPLGMSVFGKELWQYASTEGWMTKHMPPASAFTKTRKLRYVIVVDRMIYTFKKESPATDFREFFELTKHTNVFATDQFPGVLYCLEIQRDEDGRTWYLQANDVEDMKRWLDRLRKTINCLRQPRTGIVTRAMVDEFDALVQRQRQPSFDSASQRSHLYDRNAGKAPLIHSRSTPASLLETQSSMPRTSSHAVHNNDALTSMTNTFLQQSADTASRNLSRSLENTHIHPFADPNANTPWGQRPFPTLPRPNKPIYQLPDILPPQLPPPTSSPPPPPI